VWASYAHWSIKQADEPGASRAHLVRPKSWQDKPGTPLENRLHEILLGIVVTAASLQTVRGAREEDERKRWQAQIDA
jgi:hypothetical protein